MPIKKELSRSVLFVSVFAGTLISEGISLVTISEPGKRLTEKVNHVVKNMQANIGEHFHIATAKIIEESALMNSKIKKADIVVLLQIAKNSFQSSFENAKAKYVKRA